MRKEFKIFRGERVAVVENVKGLEAVVIADSEGVRFECPQWPDFNGQVVDFLKNRVGAMFEDLNNMVALQHEACDALEERGEEATNRPPYNSVNSLMVRGVLMGGYYNHHKVPNLMGVKAISGDLSYCQDNQFLASQLYINHDLQDIYSMGSLVTSFNIPPVPMLHFGSPKSADKYVKEHLEDDSNVSMLFPLLDARGNVDVTEHGAWQALPKALEGAMQYGLSVISVTPKDNGELRLDFVNAEAIYNVDNS